LPAQNIAAEIHVMNLVAEVEATLAAVVAEITAVVAVVLAISILAPLQMRRHQQVLYPHLALQSASSTSLAMTAMGIQVAQHQTQLNLQSRVDRARLRPIRQALLVPDTH
jgi:flagellar biosynthesis/type III secretory pathway M-ring protein FliF/YscJ